MSRLFYHVMQDNLGNLLFDVTGTMRLAGTGTLATIYGDEALTVPIPNPMTNHPSYGSFRCFLPSGSYDFAMAKAGYSFETLASLQGWGTMVSQDAGNVGITGGSVAGLSSLAVTGDTALSGNLGVQGAPSDFAAQTLFYLKATQHGIQIKPTDNDTGPGGAIVFQNSSAVAVGSIGTNASATSYNTTSDARLKHDVEPLTGALAVVRALRPVAFRWNADDSAGVGFLAGEVQEVIPDGVITGERGAIDSEGNILPQMIDYSKLVPFLVGALQTLAGQVEILTERVTELETGLGV